MTNNYQLYHRIQDIGRRIRTLHRDQTLAVGIIAVENGDSLATSIDQLCDQFSSMSLFVLMHQGQGDVLSLRNRFAKINFIVFSEPASFASMANVLANESYSTYFLLTRSDLRQKSIDIEASIQLLHRSDRPVAITAHLTNRLGESIPIIQAPFIRKELLDPLSFMPSGTLEPTLYPFLGVGLYERALFQRIRGFDELIETEYWQQLDFGLRCWLYGYPILCNPAMNWFFPQRQFIIEDRTCVGGIVRVHTKALGVRQMNGKNYPKRGGKYFDSELFKEVKKRLALYKNDFTQLMDKWEVPS
ncbi:MAG: hypothetical protein ACOXZ4_00200 [Sphaerochaetaceae bacterium]